MKPALLAFSLLLLFPASGYAQSYRGDPWLTRCGFWMRNRDKAWKFLKQGYDSLQFTPGERIADIGAKGATMAGMLSMFYDNLDMTLEDIDSSCLNDAQVAYAMEHYRKVNGGTIAKNNTFHVVIGNESGTTLPDTAFQKVFFINTYHEVTQKEAMLHDLYRILAPGGTLYLEERVSTNKRLRHQDCRHEMTIESELLAALQAAGFRLIKINISERYRQKGDRVKMAWYHLQKAG